MITNRQLVNRVQRGIKLLNRVKPNWFKKIKIKKLNMGFPATCVVGQLYGNFYDGMKKIARVTSTGFNSNGLCINEGAKYGFSVSDADFDKLKNNIYLEEEVFIRLKAQWIAEIRKLKKAVPKV